MVRLNSGHILEADKGIITDVGGIGGNLDDLGGFLTVHLVVLDPRSFAVTDCIEIRHRLAVGYDTEHTGSTVVRDDPLTSVKCAGIGVVVPSVTLARRHQQHREKKK